MADALDTDIPAVPEGGVVMPGNVTRDQFATEPQIQAAVGQLNAGQPVTALPIQAWSLDQQRAWNDKLTQYDRQAAVTQQAAEQAARDAAMLEQMSRVAKSTKDIEVAMQQVDIHRFQSDLANGVPAWQAAQRSPRVLTSPLVASIQNQVQPSFVPGGGAEPPHFVTRSGGVAFAPAHTTQPQHKLGDLVPVPDPTTGELLGNVVATGPTTGHFEKAKESALTVPQQALVERTRATVLQNQLREADTATFTDEKAREAYKKSKRDALEDVNQRLERLNQPKVAAPKGTNAAPTTRIRVRRKSDGKVFTYPGVAADVPTDRYDVLP